MCTSLIPPHLHFLFYCTRDEKTYQEDPARGKNEKSYAGCLTKSAGQYIIIELSECSSVWYERLVRDQEAAGSSPVIPTYLEPVGRHAQRGFSFAKGICV